MSYPTRPSQTAAPSSLSVPQIYLGRELLAGFALGAGVHSDANVYAHQGNVGLVGKANGTSAIGLEIGELKVVDVLDHRLGGASAGPHESFAIEAVVYDLAVRRVGTLNNPVTVKIVSELDLG